MILKLALRTLRARPKLTLLFVLNLSLGLSGFLTIDSFKRSFQQSMSAQSKLLLGADLVVSSRRELSEEEERLLQTAVGKEAEESRLIDILSMLRSRKTARLADIQGVDDAYPFYGGLRLEDGREIRGGERKSISSEPLIWLSPELSVQLAAGPGESVILGEREFRVDGIVVSDSSQSWKGFSLAPTAWVGREELLKTGLIRPGSTLFHERFFRFEDEAQVIRSQNLLLRSLVDPGIRIASHEKASEQVSRVLDHVNDYLGLVSLVALLLASIGAAYLFRSYLSGQILEMGVLQTLGLGRRRILLFSLVQLGCLGAAAALVAVGIAAAIQPLLSTELSQYLALKVDSRLAPRTVVLGAFFGVGGAALLCLPLLLRLRTLRAGELFQESQDPTHLGRGSAWSWIPASVAFFLLAFLLTNSWKVASLFIGAIFLSLGALALAGYLLLPALDAWSRRTRVLELRLSLRSLSRTRLSTISVFVALALGAILLNIIPQIQSNLRRELTAPTESMLPSLFVFDIQDEQLPELRAYAGERRIELDALSPMIRARLSRVNGKVFERDEREYQSGTREEQRDARSRNRTFNLSYREGTTESETIVEGRGFTGRFNESGNMLPEITLEERFSERIGVGIGDELEFDVLGIPVQGKVVGLRRVNWLSFRPNFFIVFQPGSLEDAPKIWLSAIRKLPSGEKDQLQSELVERFPNVSIIDVEKTVSKTASLFEQIAKAITGMAIFSGLVGLVVLYSVLSHRANERLRETNLLKVLGLRAAGIHRMLQLEMIIISGAAAVLGVGVSVGFAWVLVIRAFNLPWQMSGWVPLVATFAVVFSASWIGLLSSWRLIRSKPLELLQEGKV